MFELVNSTDTQRWRLKLTRFDRVDVCHMPEYHRAYLTRHPKAQALMWTYTKGTDCLAYPFLLDSVLDTGFNDISSVYGFSGPLSSTDDRAFLNEAWEVFDQWSNENRIICEFIRFSVYSQNQHFAHPACDVLPNRPISVSLLDDGSYFESLPAKTRNMIRRAQKEGLEAKMLEPRQGMSAFRELYQRTMQRNNASGFFDYTDEYYEGLLSLPRGELTLHGVFSGTQMVAAAIGLIYQKFGFYHLGASEHSVSRIGAGNLVIYDMVQTAARNGVRYFNVGGGRTTTQDDALFAFKRSNGNDVDQFYIGKRVINRSVYEEIANTWMGDSDQSRLPTQLQFYRQG